MPGCFPCRYAISSRYNPAIYIEINGPNSEQSIDSTLAWLIAEDDGARAHIQQLLADRDETFATLKNTLQEQLNGINTNTEEKDTSMNDMLETLLAFL